jgi:4-hydroxy-L-threonine phosphate dehydrogenase PdxA
MKKVPLALFQHNTGKTYIVDVTNLKASELGEGYNKNGVVIVGTLDEATNTIHATEFKAPPPPKKSFFKGCL